MFVGHLAVGFAARSVSRSTSLGWFIAAATTLDLIWPVLVLAGIEHVSIVPGATAFNPLVFDSYPWSHSLLLAVAWGSLLALLALRFGVTRQGAWLIAALVVSHWVLDFASHAPDMPLWPGNSPRLGLGLWNSIAGTYAIEGLLWLVGIALYLRHRRARTAGGAAALWSLIVISTVMWAAGPWGPPPPSERALGWFALIGWLIVPWSAWADRQYTDNAAA
jgi:hypothetical protein